ncbi:MAG: hypothetical protein U9Q17_00075, partial [Chloroflexota bacterium]|nr:hypothetical protein [Chloroflexota bacterium]
KLDRAMAIDPGWAETCFLSGLLLAREGRAAEAAPELIAPLAEHPENLGRFSEFCRKLIVYDLVSPLNDMLERYVSEASEEWIYHALLGVTAFWTGNPAGSLEGLDAAMSLLPDADVGQVFGVIVSFSKLSPHFRAGLPAVAPGWREKLSRNEKGESLLLELDKLLEGPQ